MKYLRKIKKPFLYLTLSFIAVLALFPFFWGLSGSLRPDTEFFKYAMPFTKNTIIPVEFTFESYILLFTEFNFQRPVVNTIFVTAMTIFLGLLVSSIAAFAFSIFDFKFKRTIFALILVSFMVPFESIALPLYNVANKMNLIDTYSGIILPSVSNGLVLFLFMQFFKDIPMSFIESARIDGARWMQIFFKIIIPLSSTVFITGGLLLFMFQWNSYLWPLLVARSNDIRTIQIALGDFQQERSTLWSALYAASMLSAIIPLVFFLPFQKYYIQGITSSGIKG